MSQLRVGINGFGRIGRILFRAAFENKKVEIVGINNLGDVKTLAHLLKYDSTHGTFKGDVDYDDNHLIVNGKKIPVSSVADPSKIPWSSWEAEMVFECTGAFKKKEDFEKHLGSSVKKVIVSAPADADLTVVFGINEKSYNPAEHHIISNASCTTNCLAPVAKVLHETFGIEKAMMTTIHSYTNDQRVLDAPHKDLRRARAAAQSMIPTTTGAAKAVGKVLPELNGKIDGLAVRVPTPNVSVVDFVFETQKEVSVEAINSALKTASDGPLKGILGYEEEPLVSSDFNGNSHSSIVDAQCTMVMGHKMAKVFSWYDNEMGFSHRMIDLADYIHQKG